MQTPPVQVPQLQVPQLQVPRLQAPQLQAPQVQVPQVDVPQVVQTLPNPYSVPSTPAPSVLVPPVPALPSADKASDLPWMAENAVDVPGGGKDEVQDINVEAAAISASTSTTRPMSSGVPQHFGHHDMQDMSATVHKMKYSINDLPGEIPKLIHVLDDIARIHVTIHVVVIAFKAAYYMEKTRRDNDRRISMLFASMKDMLSVLVQLREVEDPAHVGPDGVLIEARLKSVCNETAANIRACLNVCQTYMKKKLLVRVLQSQKWEEKLTAFFGVFFERRRDFELALAIHTSRQVDTIAKGVDDMKSSVTELIKMVRHIYSEEWTPSNEQQLARKIEEKGGAKFVQNNDAALSELALLDNAASSDQKSGPAAKLQGRTVQGSTFTLQDLKDELFEDVDSAIRRNMETFEGKFALYQRQLQEELTKTMQEGTSRIIDELNRGPHDKIKNEELRNIWKEMDWKLNVKARLFVMTLRDHYKERAESAAMTSFGDSQASDDWAFEFINAKYLQPIMEAFDDDGSGYVTYQEVNDFVEERPSSLGWSLPHWVAYWAVGWQITACRYRDKIVSLFDQMFSMRSSIKAENRYWADYYLRSLWPVTFELTQSLRSANVAEHIENKFQAFADYEEERIRKNLADIRFDIDALDTVYVVAGPGRIEKRDLAIFHVAQTKILHKEELLDAADSLLWVLKAVNYRYLDLSVLFKQNHLNVDNQMKVIACGLFDYLHNSTSLWTWRNLQNLNDTAPQQVESSVEDVNPNKMLHVLNYPLQDEHSFKCSLYDAPIEDDVHGSNVRTSDVVRALTGEWNGYVCTDTQYPVQLMTSFRLKPEPADNRAFRAAGIYDGVSFELLGRCRPSRSQPGQINVAFVIRYAREYSTQHFSGFLDTDGSLVGTEGWEEDPQSHTSRFIFKRVPARVISHRPPPSEFHNNRAKALWKYATRAVLNEVRRWLWSWKYFEERREVRLRYIELSTRFSAYGHKPNEQEELEWTDHRRRVLAVDASFYRILRDERLKIIPAHDRYCAGCHGKIGGARVVCLDCLSAESEAKTVDFCENPKCWTASSAEESKANHQHLPTHDIFKVRTVLHLRDVPRVNEMAEKALNVSREYFNGRLQEMTSMNMMLHTTGIQGNLTLNVVSATPQFTNLAGSVWIVSQQAQEQVFICDDCEAKTLLQCVHCHGTYKQPTWYYGTHHADNFMCNTCNWKREKQPALSPNKQHSYLHALVRCTPQVESEVEKVGPTTDERIGLLERSMGALDARMGRLEEALMRMEQLLVANLAATRTPLPQIEQSHHHARSPMLCERCRDVIPQLPPITL
ncbi:hypothetical protein NM688_g6718 [Phlebia brevispora]|uniref:Uncharacterized protein n=1 Tax=Phlebia brevispora TaxID=194682 RepID=A0ACC1SDH3_9APHY|nr:hypothetical protein NM688_g6718 [Phlebia brevispora]